MTDAAEDIHQGDDEKSAPQPEESPARTTPITRLLANPRRVRRA